MFPTTSRSSADAGRGSDGAGCHRKSAANRNSDGDAHLYALSITNRHAYIDTHTYSWSHCHSDALTNHYSNGDAYPYSSSANCHAKSDCHSNADSFSHPNARAYACLHTHPARRFDKLPKPGAVRLLTPGP